MCVVVCVLRARGVRRADRQLLAGLRPLLQQTGSSWTDKEGPCRWGAPASNIVLHLRAGKSLCFLKGSCHYYKRSKQMGIFCQMQKTFARGNKSYERGKTFRLSTKKLCTLRPHFAPTQSINAGIRHVEPLTGPFLPRPQEYCCPGVTPTLPRGDMVMHL